MKKVTGMEIISAEEVFKEEIFQVANEWQVKEQFLKIVPNSCSTSLPPILIGVSEKNELKMTGYT